VVIAVGHLGQVDLIIFAAKIATRLYYDKLKASYCLTLEFNTTGTLTMDTNVNARKHEHADQSRAIGDRKTRFTMAHDST
jgi:hypothetical protein